MIFSNVCLAKNVLVRKAEGIETAGSLNILFTDKTGTITKGELEVVDTILANAKSVSLSNLSSQLLDKIEFSICKNTTAKFDNNLNIIGGNLTDKALCKFIGHSAFFKLDAIKIQAFQEFNSKNKFSQVQIDGTTYYKGAPEKLIQNANSYYNEDGEIIALDKDVINKKINSLAEHSMRVIVLAESRKPLVRDIISDCLTIIAVLAIRDDVRKEARDAIKDVQRAGVQVVMITGDRSETAIAIAKDAGIITLPTDLAVSSSQLKEMSDEEIKNIIPRLRVVSRALPLDKSRLVRICQEMNLVTGMTGDGVNDAPALKKADVGFALASGTEAAKEQSKIVILDDNFRSIKDAILYGRTIYNNILKFCIFQLAINFTAVIVSAIAPFFGVAEPLKVAHLLFVNLVMDGLGASMLGSEGAKDEYMDEKPKRRDESLISRKMFRRIVLTSTYFIILSFVYLFVPYFNGLFENNEQFLTSYFVLFVLTSLFNAFNVRDDYLNIFTGFNENRNVLKVFFSIAFIQMAIVYSGAIRSLGSISKIFSCYAFPIQYYLLIIALAFTIVLFDCLRKIIDKKFNKL